MSARVIDGTAVAGQILQDTASRAASFERTTGRRPCLATVLVGEDPASVTYIRMKANKCRAVGIDSRQHLLSADASTEEAVQLVRHLSADETVDGILVQHPTPRQVDEREVFEAIAAERDVDGVTGASFAAMSLGEPTLVSCTPGAIMALLDAYQVDPAGQRAVVIGRSPILGKPVGMLLLARDATVTYCHSNTRDLPAAVAEADIVVAAVGRSELVRGDWIKPGAVVIDAGYNPGNIGDVQYQAAADRADLITPVPGGVGPVTIAMLLAQTVTAAETRACKPRSSAEGSGVG